MARITFDLDSQLVRELKRRSKLEGKSMGRVTSEILIAGLADSETPAAPALSWTVAELGAPDVDLENHEAVQAVLDRSPVHSPADIERSGVGRGPKRSIS